MKKCLRFIFLCCVLTAALSIVAVATDNALSVTRVNVNGWNLLHLTEKYATQDYLEKMAGILPKTVTVTLSDKQTAEISVQGAWTLDAENSRWKNSANLSALPVGTEDPDGLLNTLSVTWQIDDYTGSFSSSPQSKVIGKEGSFSMWRYMSGTDIVELWQIPIDRSAAVLRATQTSDGYSESGNSSQYAVSAWTAQDSGEWFGLYYRSSTYWHDAYLAGTCDVETQTNKAVSAAPNGWTMFYLTEYKATPEYLNIIADMLPQTVTVTLLDGQTLDIPTLGRWTPDPDNLRWTNSANPSALPAGVGDPDGVLNTLTVAWEIKNSTGSLGVSPSTQITGTQVIGQEGSFTLDRYMLGTSRVEFWQVPLDGGPAVLRATQTSEETSDDGDRCTYAIGAWTAQDAGHWLGLYGFNGGGSMYLAGVQSVKTEANKAVRAAPNGWTLFRMTEGKATAENLNIIADMLPQTVTVTLLDGQTLDIPTQGRWTPDPDNSRWTNSANPSALPDGVGDPDGVLNALAVAWQIDDYTGGFSVSSSTQIIGQEGFFTLSRYMLGTSRVEFWQVPLDGGSAVLRATQNSEEASDDGRSCKYTISAWTAEDAGYWLGLYGFSGGESMYFAGVQTVAPKTYTLTLRPSGGVLQGSDTYQTVFNGGAYHLESVPPDPIRTNYRFEGWYTQATDGEAVPVTTQTAFAMDTTLYAHWSRLSGSVPKPTVSEGKELQTVEVAGIPDTHIGIDYGYDSTYGRQMFSNLCRNPDGTFVTVDDAGDSVTVTFWSQDFQKTGQKQLPMELPLFGAFLHGETYNYLVFGQENEEEDNGKEVFRVIKYDGNFNRISAAAVRDCYTCIPFDAGSCRMAESGNHLTVHTSRLRYLTPDDGLHHQSQLTIVINTDTMEVENYLGAFQGNHVSHSFNQFVLYDGGEHVLLDHGDAYPRSVVLQRPYTDNWGNSSYQEIDLMKIPGPTGENWTGVSVGGFAQSDDFYLAAVNTVRQDAVSYGETKGDDITLDSYERDVVLLSCSKYMDAGSVRQDFLTDYYRTGTTTGVPYLVPMGENRYVILWQEFTKETTRWDYQSQGVRYALINGNGDILTDAVLLPNARLSKYCQPVSDGNNVVWYVDTGNGNRVFYRLSLPDNAENSNSTEPEIQSLRVADSVVTVTIDGILPADSMLMVALYKSNGQFVRINRADAVIGQISIPLVTEQGAFVRAFLLDKSCRPLCPVKQADAK